MWWRLLVRSSLRSQAATPNMMAPRQQGARLVAEFVFPRCVFIFTNLMLGGPNAGSICQLIKFVKKHTLDIALFDIL